MPLKGKHRNSRDRILEAATALFAAKGFRGASTRHLAKLARVNEVTIYRLFKNKQELYLKVLERKMGQSAASWLAPILRSSNDEKAVFGSVAEGLQGLFDPVFTHLLMVGALEQPGLVRRCVRPRLIELYQLLGEHIRDRIQRGAMRNLEPNLAARALVAMVFYHHIFHDLLGGNGDSSGDFHEWIKAYADIWFYGVLSQTPEPGGEGHPPRRSPLGVG